MATVLACPQLKYLADSNNAYYPGSFSLSSNSNAHRVFLNYRSFSYTGYKSYIKSGFFGRFENVYSSLHSRPSTIRKLCVRCATVDDIEEETELIQMDAMERMDKTLDSVKNNFNSIRTGRATPSLLDRIEVEYYGSNVGLKTVAQISAPEASSLLINPFDKSILGVIEKSILKSDLSLTPSNDGKVIRISIPQLTEQRRKELIKTSSKLAEDGKVAIRNVRRDVIKTYEKMEKEKKISEDKLNDLSAEIQKLTDDYVKKIESLLKIKEKDLTTV